MFWRLTKHRNRTGKGGQRLIQKIYPMDPRRRQRSCISQGERGRSAYLPKCFGKMKIITMIENEEVIKKTLKHLGLWEIKERLPPKASLRQH